MMLRQRIAKQHTALSPFNPLFFFFFFFFNLRSTNLAYKMEHAVLEVANLQPHKVLLQYDTKAHQEKLKRQPQLYAASSTEDHETVSDDARVAAYTDLLDFITGAQQECYAFFGNDESRWSVDDDDASGMPVSSTRDSSIRIGSEEWSEDDNAVDNRAGRKRTRQS